MAYAIVRLDYKNYIMPVDTAIAVVQALTDAEIYLVKYIPTDKRLPGGLDQTHHIWTEPAGISRSIDFISDDLYHLAKLAGKPDDT